MSDDILFDRWGPVGFITLNRPKALNALTEDMILAFDRQLAAWQTDDAVACVVVRGSGDRAFCAGGDVRAVWETGKALKAEGRPAGADDPTHRFFFNEYRLNRRIKMFPKTYVALLDGVAMGGGVGVSIHGGCRVATERIVLAMPETAIGLFPDVGATYALPRLPGRTGLYLGLTGDRLDHGACRALGIATHAVAAAGLEAVERALVEADWSTGPAASVLEACLSDAPPAPSAAPHPIVAQQGLIDRLFAGNGVPAIMAALAADGSDFAVRARATIGKRSPTGLLLTFEALRRGAGMDFDACMRMELRLMQACMAGCDFYEGVRAVLIDKDHKPSWSPADLAAVPAEAIAAAFDTAPSAGDLHFD